MNRLTYAFILILFLFSALQLIAQVPQGIPYQAVARDGFGQPLANQTVKARFSILDSTITGPAIFVETHTITTSQLGLFSANVGMGTVVGGSFSNINWGQNFKFLKVELDTSGIGNNYINLGTQQMMSVPYAFYSANGLPVGGGTGQILTNCNGLPLWTSDGLCPETGLIVNLNCASATFSGTLIQNTAANGVSISVPYSGGNGGTYNGQLVMSSGVTGLLASLASDSLSVGSGSLTFTITGTPSGNGVASFIINIGGQSCVIDFIVNAGGIGSFSSGTVFCYNGPRVVIDVINPATGKIWMDRNLGAFQAAVFSADIYAYGDYYQWGRRSDGHQCSASATSSILSSIDQPLNGNFIINGNAPYDWRSPQNHILWQGLNGINNPCPSGYRLPTDAEFEAERISWNSADAIGAFTSPLKLPLAGARYGVGGSLYDLGNSGNYWTSTVINDSSRSLLFFSGYALMETATRNMGYSVRCLKD